MSFPSDLRWFTRAEFTNPDAMDPTLLHLLDKIRGAAGVKIIVTDSFRSGASTSTHNLGQAVDISDNSAGLAVGSRWRHKVLKAAYTYGITRIGIYDRHIHLDVGQAPKHDQDVTWYGVSD